jgi:hypothetical protein
MNKTLVSAVVAAIAFAAPAMAWEGKTVACYDKHLVPAKYSNRFRSASNGLGRQDSRLLRQRAGSSDIPLHKAPR